jgi:arylsulfatase
MNGVSMLYSFDHPDAPDRHHVQYFEMLGNRAIYQDGWLANTTPKRLPWGGLYKSDGHADSSYTWELYDLARDYSQSHNVAAEHPDKLKALEALFDKEAKANNVYPLDDSLNLDRFHAAAKAHRSPNPVYEYWGPDISVGNEVMPPILGRSFSIDADVVIPQGGAEGVLVAAGSKFGGWGFFLRNGVPVALQSMSPQARYQFRIAGTTPIPPGPARIHFDFAYDGGGPGRGGTMTIGVNGRQVAQGRIDRTINLLAERDDTFDIGFDAGTPVSDEYVGGGRFTGDIRKVTVTIAGADPLAGRPANPSAPKK